MQWLAYFASGMLRAATYHVRGGGQEERASHSRGALAYRKSYLSSTALSWRTRRYLNGVSDALYKGALDTGTRVRLDLGACGVQEAGFFHQHRDAVDWVFVDHPAYHRAGALQEPCAPAAVLTLPNPSVQAAAWRLAALGGLGLSVDCIMCRSDPTEGTWWQEGWRCIS